MRLYEISLIDSRGRKLRRLFANAFRKGQAIAEARLALAATPGAARYVVAEV